MSIKILLADDSITIQKVIGIIFNGDEYSLSIVDNGKAAVDKAIEIIPDVLLIDALMPGMSGYEVCERVRSTPELANKPILLLTGSFEPFDETKAKECGADDFIAKPFESQQIITKVMELYERAATQPTAPTFAAPAELSFAEPAEATFAAPAEPVFAGSSESIFVEPAEPAFTAPAESFFETAAEPVIPPVIPAEPISTAGTDTADSNDIWNAFNSAPPVESILAETAAEEPIATYSSEQVESPWVPVDEQSYKFEEDDLAEMPEETFTEKGASEETSFGDVSLEPETEVESAQIEEAIKDEPVITPAPVTSAVTGIELSEEQLKAAITAASKEVIERIVWEVVPDLAETLIKEAIRRIKEGQE